METTLVTSRWSLITAAFLFLPASAAFPQGSLTPPGAPTPTMKSLDQIEARTPISSLPFTISASGSYYLTKNLAVTSGNAIVIAVDGVTLDLNGFTISSTAVSAAGVGILLTGTKRNIEIRNGVISGGVTVSGGIYSGSGFAYGILYLGEPTPANVRVVGVSVSGVMYNGIDIGRGEAGTGDSTTIESCNVRTVGGYGITGTSVTRCTAYETGSGGIFGTTVSDCYASSASNGIYADTASNCSASSSNGIALYAVNAINCTGVTTSSSAFDEGLLVTNATNCVGSGAAASGISTYTATNCYGSSTSRKGIILPHGHGFFRLQFQRHRSGSSLRGEQFFRAERQ